MVLLLSKNEADCLAHQHCRTSGAATAADAGKRLPRERFSPSTHCCQSCIRGADVRPLYRVPQQRSFGSRCKSHSWVSSSASNCSVKLLFKFPALFLCSTVIGSFSAISSNFV